MKTILLCTLLVLSGMVTAQAPQKEEIKKQSSLIELVKGNWFTDDNRNTWDYGVYDSIIIAHNRIYTNESIQKKGKNIEVTFSDRQTGLKGTLSFAPEKSGKYAIAMNHVDRKRYTRIQKEKKTVSAEGDFQQFFRTDTACLQGYIDKYDPNTAPQAGLIALTNGLTRESNPVAVPILSDGSFSVKLPLNYPVENFLVLSQCRIPFYIEPGQTQTIYIDWEKVQEFERQANAYSTVKNVMYMGDSSETAQLLRNLQVIFQYRNDSLEAHTSLVPNQFKEKMQPVFKLWDQKADSLIRQYLPSKKAAHLIRNEVSLKKGEILLYFLLLREFQAQRNPNDLSAQVKADSTYFEFMRAMPMNDETIIALNNCHLFMNQFELMETILRNFIGMQVKSITNLESVISGLCGQSNSFIKQLTIVDRLYMLLRSYPNRESARDFIDSVIKKGLTHPTLIAEADRMLDVIHPKDTASSYQLPKGKATDIFRNIIKKYAGKVLFIDFWATTCGACRFGIESIPDLRKQYKNHPEFQFIYITSQRESPEKDYNEYVEKNLKDEVCLRLSETEFNYLRELFHFNGLPHYKLVEKDGTISRKNLHWSNLKNYLEQRFGK